MHSNVEAGTYSVRVTGAFDGESDAETYDYIAIYDLDGGFATGGRWIVLAAHKTSTIRRSFKVTVVLFPNRRCRKSAPHFQQHHGAAIHILLAISPEGWWQCPAVHLGANFAV